jgi:uncharacterized protein (DUF433 family)
MKPYSQQDLRELPAYTIAEAAGYLSLPVSTLRSWTLGQTYRAGDETKVFRPVIEIADRADRKLSFVNLVEAFVLAGIRRRHSIPLPKVRKAVGYLRKEFHTRRPLAEERFETDGVNLFVKKFGALVGATQDGQIQLEEVIRDRLKQVLRDPMGVPEKIVLFRTRESDAKGDVVIDPRLSFGRPVLDGYGLRTAILAERFYAGESVEELAKDYGVPSKAIQNALRCEPRAA